MTIGENIRRIRKARGLTIRQLGEMIGVSESYVRAYESGRRHPKDSSLQEIANALAVNPEVLKNSDFDGITAMHRLFQVFRQYGGHLSEITRDGEEATYVALTFNSLGLMRSWLYRYEEYEEQVRKANLLPNNAARANALMAAEESFNLWMDMYPETDPDQKMVEIQRTFDEHVDYYGLHPKTPEDN